MAKEKCAMLITKSEKRPITEEIEQPNPEKIRFLGEKETHKYLRILKTDSIKQERWKKQFKNKNALEEQENYLKPNYVIEISPKG